MACNHKFIDFLNLERLDFEPTTLIVGTFNPMIEGNLAEWFYGRTHDEHGNRNNNFWDVLPRLNGEPSLINAGPAAWKAFCSRNSIAITDLITTIEDANPANPNHVRFLGCYSDKAISDNFNDFVFTNIIELLQQKPTINNVYITNGVNGQFWISLWNPINQYCTENHIFCNTLLTPSKNARFSMFTHNINNSNNQFNMASLNNYILMKWQANWNN